MFDALFFKLVGIHFRTVKIFGGAPFHWDNREKRVYTTKWSILWCLLNSIGLYTTTIYIGLRVLSIKLWGSLHDLGFPMGLFLAACFDSVGFICLSINPRHKAATVNAMLKYWEDVCRKWKPGYRPSKSFLNWLLDIFLLGTFFLEHTAPILVVVHYFLFPKSPSYLFSVLPPIFFNPLTYVAFGLQYLWLLYSIFGNICTMLWMGVVYIYLSFRTLPKEFSPNSKTYFLLGSFRQPRTLQHEYRTFEILHKNVNEMVDPVIVPYQSVITQFSLSCLYLLIKDWDLLDTTTTMILCLWTCGATMAWTGFLQYGGFLSLCGKRTLKSWKYYNTWPTGERKILGRFRRGCRPIAMRAGGYHCIKTLSVLKFMRGIIRGTFRALLTLERRR